MSPYDDTLEKLYEAVLTLATSNSPLKHRIREAWQLHLHRLIPKPAFPPELEKDFDELHAEMFWEKAIGNEGSYAVSAAAMTADAARRHAHRIVALFNSLLTKYGATTAPPKRKKPPKKG
jgi:hypothetical protein